MRATDNFIEFYLSTVTIENNLWSPNIYSMLGTVILLPTFFEVCKISLVWIYKLVVPILSTFIPLGLYELFRRKTNDEIAFFSTFFFISQFVYFTWVSVTMKMVSASIFFMLLLLLMEDDRIKSIKKHFLLIVFTFSLITSHYGTSYVFMFIAIISFALLLLFNKKDISSPLSPNFLFLYITAAVTWYIYTAGAINFEVIVKLGEHFISTLLEFWSVKTGGKILLTGTFCPSWEILRILYIISGFFSLTGVIWQLYKTRSINKWFSLALSSLLFLSLPYVSGVAQYAGGRMFYITSFILSPFCILGSVKFFQMFYSDAAFSMYKKNANFIFVAVFLAIFLLSNTGFFSEIIFKDNPGASMWISKERVLKGEDIRLKENFYRYYIPEYDWSTFKWLDRNKPNAIKIYADKLSREKLAYAGISPNKEIGSDIILTLTNKTEVDKSSYVFLSYFNTITGKIKVVKNFRLIFYNTSEVLQKPNMNKIYDNGGSEIYFNN